MKNFLLISLAGLLSLLSTTYVNAQDAEVVTIDTTKAALSISGSADVYYRANLNGDYDAAPLTSFANLPGFSLGMANVVLAHEGAKVGFTADLVFGPRGEDATFLSGLLRPVGEGLTNNSSIVNQLYAYWNVSDAVTLTIGNFNTFLGYEVISPTSNFNYSTSYLFSYGPFSHTGLKVDVALGGGFSLMGGVFNSTDFTEYNLGNEYAAGLQLGYDNDKGLGVYLNGLFSEEFYQLDLTAGYEITDDLYFGVNASSAKELFFGVAGYLQYSISDQLGLGTRVEYFADMTPIDSQEVFLFGPEENVLNATLSANYSIGNLTLIPEFRMDMFSTSIVPSDGDTEDSLSSFVLAAVYGF